MMTISKLGESKLSGGGGSSQSGTQSIVDYYLSNYYLDDVKFLKGMGVDLGSWHGKAAAALGLVGEVKPEDFKNMLDGKVRGNGKIIGKQLGKKEADGSIKHAPGWDMTTNAPKSVSILATIGGDKILIAAHQRANQVAMGFVEKNAAYTRRRINGIVTKERTGKLAYASFTDVVNRNNEPHLHTHNPTMNTTLGAVEDIRSIDSKLLYDIKMISGLIYRNELVIDVKKMGYEIRQTSSDGLFEIAGIKQSSIDFNSQRTKEIKDKMRELGMSGAKDAEIANLLTRKNKTKIEYKKLKQEWKKNNGKKRLDNINSIFKKSLEKQEVYQKNQDEMVKIFTGIAPDDKPSKEALAQGAREYAQLQSSVDSQEAAVKAVDYAIKHLSEQEAVFSGTDVFKTAIAHNIGSISNYEKVESCIGERIIDKTLMEAKTKENVRHFTTKKALKVEANLKQMMYKQKAHFITGVLKNIVNTDKLTSHLTKYNLTSGQEKAAKLILNTQDRFVAVQGYAGTGKTYMLNAVREQAEKNGYSLVGMAPSATAANILEGESGIKSHTVQKHLTDGLRQFISKEKIDKQGKELWVVDESSMIDTYRMDKLTKLAIKQNARVVFVGDMEQLGAIEAGKPFTQIQKTIETAQMTNILRQNDPRLRDAVQAMAEKNINKAFEVLAKFGKEDVSLKGFSYGILPYISEYKDFQKAIKTLKDVNRLNDKDIVEIAKIRDNNLENNKQRRLLGYRLEQAKVYGNKEEIEKTQNMINNISEVRMFDGNCEKFITNLKIMAKDGIIKQQRYLNIKEIQNKDDRLKEAANLYVKAIRNNENVLLITPKNIDRVYLNDSVRNKFKEIGILSKEEGIITSTLFNKNATRAEKTRAFSYLKGNMVLFNRDYKKLGVSKGEYLTVKKSESLTNIVTLTNKDGKDIKWNPDKIAGKARNGVEVYQVSDREVSVNDNLMWRRVDKENGRRTAEEVMVIAIDKKTGIVEYVDNNGEIHKMNVNDFDNKHWDYAYAKTVYGSQGATVDKVIAMVDPYNTKLTTQQSFYVELSRAKNEAIILTNDQDALPGTIKEQTGEKTSAYDQAIEKLEHTIKADTIREMYDVMIKSGEIKESGTANTIDMVKKITNRYHEKITDEKTPIPDTPHTKTQEINKEPTKQIEISR